MGTHTSFTSTIQQYDDTEDLFIEIPPEVLQNLNWEEGEELEWYTEKNGTISIRAVKDTTESKEEPTLSDFDWYTEKDNEIKNYLESESEGKEYKDYDEAYDDYIETSIEETSSLEGYEFSQD